MTIREATIAKLQQLPESLLSEVDDFIDFVTHKHQYQTKNQCQNVAQAWAEWFESVERLENTPTEPVSEYQQRLLNKYRQQGLEL